jgi:hypothetical protein
LRHIAVVQWDVELKLESPEFAKAVEDRGGRLVSQRYNEYRLEFPTADGNPTQKIFVAAREAGAQIRILDQAQRTLEDAFMEAVS